MENALRETLEQGERIVWESGVRPFRLFDGKEGKALLLRWLICTAIAAALLAGYASTGGRGVSIYLVALAALALIVCLPILSYRQTLGQRYYVTDRRAVTLRPDGTAYSMSRAHMGEVRLYKLDCGGEALALGSLLLAERDKQLRWRANHPLENSNYVIEGLVFYRPENAEAALRILNDGEV